MRPRSLLRSTAATIALAVSSVVLVVPALGAGEDGVDQDADAAAHPLLVQARRNVAEVEQRLASARGDRRAAAAALAEVDRRLAAVEQAVNDAVVAVEQQRLAVVAAGDRLVELQEEVVTLERRLRDRSVRLYMRRQGGGDLASMLAAGAVRDAADRSSYLDLVGEGEAVSLESASAARTALDAATDRFDAETARLEEMEAQQRQLLADVQQLRDTRAAALAATDAQVADLEQLQDDVSDDQDRIAELIAAGTVTSVAAASPSAEGYGWPVCSRLTSGFGRRWGRLHAGIDLGGSTGDPIAAARAGTVVFAGARGGYGNLTLVDHGDGVVTAYAHQSRIGVSVGQRVERGELIGLLGSTGNSTGPHLHFETRVNGSPVDPLTYLPASC